MGKDSKSHSKKLHKRIKVKIVENFRLTIKWLFFVRGPNLF